MGVEVNPESIQTCSADDRGRVYLGTEYANKKITVAVLDDE